MLRLAIAMAAWVIMGGTAAAETPSAKAAAPIDPQSWAGQLEGLSAWLEARRGRDACTNHCFLLSRLTLRGSLADGALSFELEGGVLEGGATAVPLFGPPSEVRIEGATIDGKPAVIGFEGDHYFLHTAARRFTLKGKLVMGSELALLIPGPLNALTADLAEGRLVEGSRLSGIEATTIHFDRTTSDSPQAEPTVFQLARAIRVGRAIDFEYRLVMRSGSDLGVARLPLQHGERVLEVEGVTGWRVEGQDVLLPTAGRTAEIRVRGTLPKIEHLTPDARSSYEWFLVESDPEHRVLFKGDASQVDAAESPIARTQPSSRLYLVKPGQSLDLTVQTLTSTDVLAAVVRHHQRTLVLTKRGDLVADDTLSYENNGIDYLPLDLRGRPIYLGIDGKAESILQDDVGAREVLVPLANGSHVVRTQSLAQVGIGTYGGKLSLPMPSYALTASTTHLTLGLPHHVHPLALIGGDRSHYFVGLGDLLAVVAGVVAAFLSMRTRKMRILGAASLAGLWFISHTGFVALLAAFVVGAALLFVRRLRPGYWQVAGISGCAVLAFAGVVTVMAIGLGTSSDRAAVSAPAAAPASQAYPSSGSTELDQKALQERAGQSTDQSNGQNAQNGQNAHSRNSDRDPKGGAAKDAQKQWVAGAGSILRGVTPVALTLPSYDRALATSRELVTRERPFSPALYYVTDYGLAPWVALWLGITALVLYGNRDRFRAVHRSIREKLQQATEGGRNPTWSPSGPAGGTTNET